jgi:cobalt-zinc-cadmium resistance protein CzcA
VLKSIRGAADVSAEQLTGQPVMRISINQEKIALYGIPAQEVLTVIESVGGVNLGEVIQGEIRYPLVVRLPERFRDNPEALQSVQFLTAKGERIPLSRLATFEEIDGPSTINREWSQRRIAITCNVRDRDLGSFVDEAQRKLATDVRLPSGRYHIDWGGQFEHLIRATNRLMIVVPLALLLIFLLLYLTYGTITDTLRVFTGVPFAWIGGLVALWLRDMPFSVSAAIGFIALSGVAVLDDMILVSTIRQFRRAGIPLDEAVEKAALVRLRPVLMTTLVASLGFVPMAFSTGMGAEVQRPLATVVIGGVISAMIMSLLVVRVLYVVLQRPSRTPH